MSPALRAHSLSYEPTWKSLQVCSGILLYSGSQSFSRFGLLLLLLFRIFSLFCLIVGLPSVPGRWYKAMKQTWWQFLGIAGDCEFRSKTKKGPFQCHALCPLKLYPSLISPAVHFCSFPFPFLLEVLIQEHFSINNLFAIFHRWVCFLGNSYSPQKQFVIHNS